MKSNIMLNVAIMIPAYLLAMFYPQVGSIAGKASAFGSVLCIYTLPLACYLGMRY